MKLPNPRKLGTLTALAVLLAWMSTGCLTLCGPTDPPEQEQGTTLNLTLQAGDTVNAFALLSAWLAQFALCDLELSRATSATVPAGALTTVPAGVYTRCNRDLRGEPSATVDLITSASTPPGVYVLEYRDASPGSYVVGTLNLTIEAAHNDVTACLAAFGDGEIIFVNQTVTFYSCCSQSPENDPIVEYKWWFNYNGNPSSAPSQTVTPCETTGSYSTPGIKTVRLVVRTQSGKTAEGTTTITVNAS